MINPQVKRIYDEPSKADGFRILVDRIWPRGMSKQDARIDLWLKDIAPSTELRKWFGHELQKWSAFKQKYFKELDQKRDSVEVVAEKAAKATITLLYGAKDTKDNNAQALKEHIETL